MSTEDNTGGPAFPRDHAHDGHNGMTLRDYFAAKAMQGYVVQGKSYDFADIAQASYRVADTMLKARES
jgi:hypothetical protein